MRVTYTIDKGKVLTEVRRLTAYAAQRKGEEAGLYEATESDNGLLEQFWNAACSATTEQLMQFAKRIDNDTEGSQACYEVTLDMASQYDTRLNESIEDSLQNFFINIIASKWFEWAGSGGKASETAAAAALGYMGDVEKKIYHRKRPERVHN